MNIQCTQCQASYVLSATALGETGRKVKCVKCLNVWFVKPEDSVLARAVQVENYNLAVNNTGAISLPAVIEPKIAFYHYLLPALLIMCIITVSSIIYYDRLLDKPIFSSFYKYFGAVDSRDIVFDQVSIKKGSTDKGMNLYIQGYVVNVGKKDVPLPYIKFTVYDVRKKEIFTHLQTEKIVLKPNDSYKIENTLTRLTGRESYVMLDVGNRLSFYSRAGL